MALLCRPLCWGCATAYVHHKPHTVPLWGCAPAGCCTYMILHDDYGEASRMLLSSKKLKQNKKYYIIIIIVLI